MKKYITISLFLFMFSCFNHLLAEESSRATEDEQTDIHASEKNKQCKSRVIASPLLFYFPETRLGFGGAGSYIFRVGRCEKNKNGRPSSISPFVVYTLEKQFIAHLGIDLYLKNDAYHLTGEIKLLKYPDKFFGVGNHTLKADEEAYTSKSTSLFLSFLKKLGKGFNIGVQYHFSDWNILEAEEGGQLKDGNLPGSQEGTLSGVSLVVNHDTRDNIFFPIKGDFIELNSRTYKKFLGSDFDFTDITLDARKYIKLFSSNVLAVQSLVKIQTGTVPFLNLARIGGPNIMRGYFEGRFRDKNLLVFQAEYRMPLFWRVGLVGFAGLGNVAEKFSQLKPGEFKSSYGFGFRFLFDPKEKIQVRMDIGFGKDSSGFYFSIFEAF